MDSHFAARWTSEQARWLGAQGFAVRAIVHDFAASEHDAAHILESKTGETQGVSPVEDVR